MSDLTEVEIFDCMIDSLRRAIGHCRDLAVKPLKGPSFIGLRAELKLVEGCCRQAAAWRQDARWYPLGQWMEDTHQFAKEWLIGVKDPVSGRRFMLPEGVKHPSFVKLADNLENLLNNMRVLKDGATGRSGAILPLAHEGPHRQTKDAYGVTLPAGMERRDSGLIIPVACTSTGLAA